MSSVAEILTTIIMIAFWLTVYFLPSIIARQKPFIKQVFLLNLLLGWTFIGWIIALIWSTKNNQKTSDQIIINYPPNSSNINNITQLEKLNQLYQQGIVTQSEFIQQKDILLGNPPTSAKTPTPSKKISLNKKINIAIISTLVLGFALIAYGSFSPFFDNQENAVQEFLINLESQNTYDFLKISPQYHSAVRQSNALPKITGFAMAGSAKIDTMQTNPNAYFVFARIRENDGPRSVTFLVAKQGSDYSIIDSYDFLNTGTNQIVFPANMGDTKRVQMAKQKTNPQILLSTCNFINNTAAGSIEVKNNFTLPVKNLKIQVQYLDKQKQEVNAQIVNAITNDDDEILPQQSRIISWVTNDCKNCQTANVTILNN